MPAFRKKMSLGEILKFLLPCMEKTTNITIIQIILEMKLIHHLHFSPFLLWEQQIIPLSFQYECGVIFKFEVH